MDDEREGDIRVPLLSFLFCLCLITGGVFLVIYVFVPNLSQPWYPIAAFVLIGSPWLFWFFTYAYACTKGCCGGSSGGGGIDNRQISRLQTTPVNTTKLQNHHNNGGSSRGQQQSGGVNPSVASSKESEMPLTYSV